MITRIQFMCDWPGCTAETELLSLVGDEGHSAQLEQRGWTAPLGFWCELEQEVLCPLHAHKTLNELNSAIEESLENR